MTKFTGIAFIFTLILLIVSVEAKEERKLYETLINLCTEIDGNTKNLCEAKIKYEDFNEFFMECLSELSKAECMLVSTSAILIDPDLVNKMTPKAKASIIVPAAKTWSKLQQAYVMETDKIGDAIKIGYTPPYGAKPSNSGADKYFTYKIDVQNGMAVFSVKNKKELGGCPSGSEWKIIGKLNKGDVTFETAPPKNTKCVELTPDFKELK